MAKVGEYANYIEVLNNLKSVYWETDFLIGELGVLAGRSRMLFERYRKKGEFINPSMVVDGKNYYNLNEVIAWVEKKLRDQNIYGGKNRGNDIFGMSAKAYCIEKKIKKVSMMDADAIEIKSYSTPESALYEIAVTCYDMLIKKYGYTEGEMESYLARLNRAKQPFRNICSNIILLYKNALTNHRKTKEVKSLSWERLPVIEIEI